MGIGMWYEMYISDPGRVSLQEHRPARIAARQRQQRDRALPEQHAARRHARDAPHDEPGRARGGLATSRTTGATGSDRCTSARCTSATADMIRQIEEKVVNRLRQVTSAIRQDGANQVSIITNTAERTAAVEFAKAAAMRPQIVGAALNRISEDPEIEAALFEVLENQKLLEGEAPHHARAHGQRAAHAVAGRGNEGATRSPKTAGWIAEGSAPSSVYRLHVNQMRLRSAELRLEAGRSRPQCASELRLAPRPAAAGDRVVPFRPVVVGQLLAGANRARRPNPDRLVDDLEPAVRLARVVDEPRDVAVDGRIAAPVRLTRKTQMPPRPGTAPRARRCGCCEPARPRSR